MERYESGRDGSSWKNLAERMEEDKYKVKDSKREAHRGRGAPLEWRRVRRSKKVQNKKVEGGLLGKNFRLVQSKQEELAEEEEMTQQQRMENEDL